MELLIFFCVPFFVESVLLEWIQIAVSLVLTFAINALERMRARFSFLNFKSWWIHLEVCLAIPCHFSMMFYFIRSITFDVFGPMHAASKCCMIPLPTILVLGYTWVYICISDCYNVVKNTRSRLNIFLFLFLFLFSFWFIFIFLELWG